MPVHQDSYQRETVKNSNLKICHFALFPIRILKKNCHTGYFDETIEYTSNTKKAILVFLNLKRVTYAQPIPLSLIAPQTF